MGLQGERADEAARIRERLAEAVAGEQRAAATLAATEAGRSDERARLRAAEDAASSAREEVRAAEGRARAAEVAAMSARLQLDSGREALLVELAGIGADGLRALTGADAEPDPDTLGAQLDLALDATLAGWTDSRAVEQPAIPAGRLVSLRRRYHELGAGNPFAAQELAEVRERLDGLESQQADLDSAIRDRGPGRPPRDAHRRPVPADLRGAGGGLPRRFEQLFGAAKRPSRSPRPTTWVRPGSRPTARPPARSASRWRCSPVASAP